jgi:hypothetical protein
MVILLHINLKPFGMNKQKYTKLNCYPKSIHSHQLTIFFKIFEKNIVQLIAKRKLQWLQISLLPNKCLPFLGKKPTVPLFF